MIESPRVAAADAPWQFVIRLARPPLDEHVEQLFDRTGDLCIEVGAWRGWMAVAADRPAASLVEAVVATVRDLDAAGIVPVDAGPDDDLVPLWLVAERAGCAPAGLRRWAAAESGPGDFPAPVTAPAGVEAWYRWSAVDPWLRNRVGLRPPETASSVFTAANLVFRMRGLALQPEELAVVMSLL